MPLTRPPFCLFLLLCGVLPTLGFVVLSPPILPAATPTRTFPSSSSSSRLALLPATAETCHILESSSADSWQLLVAHAADMVAHEGAAKGLPFLPALGSSLIMLTIVGLLYLWEESVEWIRETVPASLLPVAEAILAEIGGLGFIGLVLQTVGSATSENLQELSLLFFGEKAILIECFEFLHSAFFQVGIGFFLAAGAMVAVGLEKLTEIETVQDLQLNKETGACTVTAEKLARYVPVTKTADDSASEQSSSLWKEIMMGKEERAGKSLLMRNLLVDRFNLPETFRIEVFIQRAFATNLLGMVKLSPLTWIYLIPALALANSIDLSHEVVNASSPNAADSVGYFFSTPWALWPSVLSFVLSCVWGVWNCWKMTEIKYMLLPRLGRDEETSQPRIFPALVDIAEKRQAFNSSPSWIRPIESRWAKPPQNSYHELFGTIGAGGVNFYRNSIKFQAWLCITQIVFFGTQIVPRDINALVNQMAVGDPVHLTAELATYGTFVLVSFLSLIFVTPRAFWNFCLVASLEDKTSESLLGGMPSENLVEGI